jgi:hypothetical protein
LGGYEIEADGAIDLHIMERVTRTPDELDKNYHSLQQCIEQDAGLSTKVARRWKEVKEGMLFCATSHKHYTQILASMKDGSIFPSWQRLV